MQYNYNIELNTYKDIIDFVKIIGTLPPKEKILVTSGDLSGNARSLLNMMATVEWEDLVCRADIDIYSLIKKWIKE